MACNIWTLCRGWGLHTVDSVVDFAKLVGTKNLMSTVDCLFRWECWCGKRLPRNLSTELLQSIRLNYADQNRATQLTQLMSSFRRTECQLSVWLRCAQNAYNIGWHDTISDVNTVIVTSHLCQLQHFCYI